MHETVIQVFHVVQTHETARDTTFDEPAKVDKSNIGWFTSASLQIASESACRK